MNIGKACKRKTFTISEDASLIDAANLMEHNNIGFLVVKDDSDNIPIGTITDRDIVTKVISKRLDPESIKVGDVMSGDLLILNNEDSIKETIELMRTKGVRRAPIIENEEIIGLVSIDDLIIILAEELNGLGELIKKQIY